MPRTAFLDINKIIYQSDRKHNLFCDLLQLSGVLLMTFIGTEGF